MKHLLETKTSWKRRTRINRENEENLAAEGDICGLSGKYMYKQTISSTTQLSSECE